MCTMAFVLFNHSVLFAAPILFAPPVSTPIGREVGYLEVEDLNEDGNPDLVVGKYPGGVDILWGIGNGWFSSPQLLTNRYSMAAAVADFNNDGHLDIAVANSSNQGSISVYAGDGTGNFSEVVGSPFSVYNSPSDIAVADLNRDGNPDLCVANRGGNLVFNGSLSVLLGEGDGTFGPASIFHTGIYAQSLAIGQFNGDEHHDLAVAHSERNLTILFGDGRGTFGSAADYETGPGPRVVKMGDLNDDGVLDLVTANSGQFTGPPDQKISTLLGEGDGSFGPATHIARTSSYGWYAYSVAIGDLDGDGVPDLVSTNQAEFQDHVSIMRGAGDGTFETAVHLAVTDGVISNGVRDVVMADLQLGRETRPGHCRWRKPNGLRLPELHSAIIRNSGSLGKQHSTPTGRWNFHSSIHPGASESPQSCGFYGRGWRTSPRLESRRHGLDLGKII